MFINLNMNADQIAFQEKFKDQMQTMGKNGILGTLNSNRNNSDNRTNLPVKIIHHTAYENVLPHRKNLLKPIKPQTPSVSNMNDTTNRDESTNQQECSNISNNPYINQPLPPNGSVPYNPYMYPPPQQMNPYCPPPYQMMMNPYYNNPYIGYNNIHNNGVQQQQYNNNIQLPTPQSRTRLRPISSQSRMNTTNTNTTNLSNLSSGRVCSAYSRSRISTVEYKPYTLKEYKEMERVGVVLGGLGPNIGTKEWEEKKEKMKKMEEYAKRVGMLKNKIKKRKERVEDIIEKEKKKKIENSIRRRCYEYANLVRPKTRIEQRVNRTNLLNNNTNNTTKCTIDCDAPSFNTTMQKPEIKILSKNKSLGRITRQSPYVNEPNKEFNNSRRQKSSMAIDRYHIEEDNNNTNLDDIINNNVKNEGNELNIDQNSELSKLLQARENYMKVIDKIKNTL